MNVITVVDDELGLLGVGVLGVGPLGEGRL